MEFPTVGAHCQFVDCNQNDFLPLQCKCGRIFCRDHFNNHSLSGECDLAPKPREYEKNTPFNTYQCSTIGCRKGDLNQMLCNKCNLHFCIEHRFHPSCPEIDDETMAAKIEEHEAPRKQFQEANKHLQEKITENIRKALKSSAKVKTASKIHLMRVKQKAIGPKNVPASYRVYFAIKKPINMDPKPVRTVQDIGNIKSIESITLDPDLKDTVPVFIGSKWSLGRAIDGICDTCNITNDNNKVGNVKLRLFRQLDGYCISPTKMDVEIAELMAKEVLLEGDKLIMEYISVDVLNNLDESTHIFLA